MKVVISNVAILVIFSLIGWILRKKNILSGENLKLLSVLEVWVFLPCKTFQGFASNCNVPYLSEKYLIIVVSIVILTVLVILNRWLVPMVVKGDYRQKIVRYSLTVPNYGYFGYALIESIYGELALLDMMMFALPISFYTYTEGYRMLTNQKTVSLRRIVNPVFISILIGCVFGLTQWELPLILNDVVNKSAACMAPVSMLLAGIMIAEYSTKEILRNKAAYGIAILRLLGIPMMLCLVLSPFFAREIMLVAVLFYAMPCGMNTIIFPNLIGEDCKLGASLAMISTVASLITIPLCVQVIEFLCV